MSKETSLTVIIMLALFALIAYIDYAVYKHDVAYFKEMSKFWHGCYNNAVNYDYDYYLNLKCKERINYGRF